MHDGDHELEGFTVIGRDRELSLLLTFIDAARTGHVGLIIEGGAGIGKTTLWRVGVRHANENGVTVIRATPSRAEQQLSYSGLRDLVAAIIERDPDAFSRLAPHISTAVLTASRIAPPIEMPIDALTVAAGLRGALTALSLTGPIMVAIDDVQWLDDASATVLSHSFRRPVGAESLLLSRRVGDPEVDDSVRGSRTPLELPDWVEPLPLRALDRDDVIALVSARWPKMVGSPMATSIAELSAGNPFLADELGRANHRKRPTDQPEVPSTLTAAPEARVRDLSPQSREIILLAALAAQPTLVMVAAASPFGPSDAFYAATVEAIDAGVIEVSGDTVRFRHPLYATAAVAISGGAATRAAHAWLASVATDPEQIAVHLDAATIGPDETVAQALLTAARSVFHRGAASRAEALATRAIEHAAPQSLIRPLAATVRGEVAFLHGDLIEAERMLTEAVGCLPPALSGAPRIALFRVIFEQDFTRAGPYLDQAIDATAPGPDLVDLHLWRAHVLTGEMRMADAEAAAAVAHAGAVAIGNVGLLAETTAVCVIVAMMAGRGLDRAKLDDALRMRDPARPWHPIADPLLVETVCCYWAGEHDAGMQATIVLAEHLELREASMLDAYALAAGIASACALGRTDIAQRFHARASMNPGLSSGFFKTSAHLATAYLAAFQGDADGAVEAMETLRASAEATGMRMPQMPLVTARPLALVLNLAGRFAELDTQIGPLAAFAMAVDYPEPGVVAWVADWAVALVELGRADEAANALDWLGHKADALERTWVQGLVARGRSHLAGARGDIDHAIDLASQSIDLFADPPNPFEVARSRLHLGLLYRRKRMRRAGAAEFQHALAFFQASGYDALAARTQADLDRIVGTRADTNELTATERGVAQLAADGLTNREIAVRLNMSGKTVEAHLSRVFRKLNVRRRVDLLRALQAEGRSVR